MSRDMEIQTADLLFVPNQHHDMDEAIAASTGNYVHVAIAMDSTHVIHASPRYGVVIQTLTVFLEESNHVDVYRPKVENSDGVVARARRFENRPYNFSFYKDDSGVYCSQLVADVFKGVIDFDEEIMQFGDGEHQISDFWSAYYLKLGVDVPLNQLGTNPNKMATSEHLKLIGKL